MPGNGIRLFRLLPVLFVALSGCAVNNKDMLHFLPEREHEVSAIEYRVGIPDAVAIIAPRIEEIGRASCRERV